MSTDHDQEAIRQSIATVRAIWSPKALDGITLHELQTLREDARRAVRRLDDTLPICLTCDRFDFVRTCAKHGDVAPEFQQQPGCPDWVLAVIPF